MTAYDFWEPLSIRMTPRVLASLQGWGRGRDRARALQSWIHCGVVPIGLLRELEPPERCRSCGYSINPACDDHFTVNSRMHIVSAR
jgi:hypothetical protein